jgi:hypothetical protein
VPSIARRTEGITPRTKPDYLRGLVADKNRWSHPHAEDESARDFPGWHERGYLPH